MAAPTTLKLVENRLPASTHLSDIETTEVAEFIDEAKVSRGYVDGSGDPDVDANLSRLQVSYIADLAAIAFLTSRLNRYMEDAKIKFGADGVTEQKYDKEKFIAQQIKGLVQSAKGKGQKLGFGANILPTGVVKVVPYYSDTEDA